jgi:hypothetical protein
MGSGLVLLAVVGVLLLLIATAMGTSTEPAPGGAVGAALLTPAVAAGQLLTTDEVERAIGHPVTTRNATGIAAGPVSVQMFDAGDRRAVYVTVTGGLPGRLAMRYRRGGTPLPGIGDEAYAGDGWAVGRRGDDVVMVRLHDAADGIDPHTVYRLLATAVGHLPGGERH